MGFDIPVTSFQGIQVTIYRILFKLFQYVGLKKVDCNQCQGQYLMYSKVGPWLLSKGWRGGGAYIVRGTPPRFKKYMFKKKYVCVTFFPP